MGEGRVGVFGFAFGEGRATYFAATMRAAVSALMAAQAAP